MKKKKRITAFEIVFCVILGLYCVSLFVPMLWGFITSVKDPLEYRWNIMGLPTKWHFDNYQTVLNNFFMPVETLTSFRNVYLGEMLFNTLVYTFGTSIVSVITSASMAYITARFNYKFSKFIYLLIIITMIFPVVGSLPSELQIAKALNLHDSLFSIIIMKTYFFGLYYLVFYAAFSNLPKDFAEAAKIDGAGNFTVMIKIMLPCILPTFFSVFLLRFIGFWNDYQSPMVFMPNHPTLAYGMYHFANECYINEIKKVPMQVAGCLMLALPTLLIFIIFQNKLMNNVSMGGLKG